MRQARSLGFSMAQMRELLAPWRDGHQASADVKRLPLAHAAELDWKAQAIAEVSRALRHLATTCEGNDRRAARSWTVWPRPRPLARR